MRPTLALVTAGLLTLCACGSDDGPDRGEAGRPTELQQVGAGAPEGFERVICELRSGDRQESISLAVPQGSERLGGTEGPLDNACAYRTPESGEVRVVLLHATADLNEEDDIGTLESMRAGFEDYEGEDAPFSVEWQRGEPALGETVGDRLSWLSEYEGEDELNLRVEADGVQVWVTAGGLGSHGQEPPDFEEVTDVFDEITATVGAP